MNAKNASPTTRALGSNMLDSARATALLHLTNEVPRGQDPSACGSSDLVVSRFLLARRLLGFGSHRR
jgi:hypothetical protein